MICKKIGNPKKSSSKATRAGGLVTYIAAPEQTSDAEKCIYSNGRNFLTDTLAGMKAEMIALSQEAVRSKDPINHYVLSWREGEQPTTPQIEQCVDIVLDELGLQEHQVFYGLHADTDNLHLHIAVNRVHPETLKVIKPNKGFDLESLHKAVARIEHVQGWQSEKNARYKVTETGEPIREQRETKQQEPPSHIKDEENRTGEKSACRIAIERGSEILKSAKTWQELHKRLGEKGLRYERFGSGAKIYLGDIPLKASDVDRNASLGKMQKKIGIFEPSTQEKPNVYIKHKPTGEPHPGNPGVLTQNCMRDLSKCRLAHHGSRKIEGVLSVNARAYRRAPISLRREPARGGQLESQPTNPGTPGWNEFINGRKLHYAGKSTAKQEMDNRQTQERQALAEQQKAKRNDLFSGSWKGKGVLLNAMRSVVAAEQAAEKSALKDKHKMEREEHRDRFRPWPVFETWLIQKGQLEIAEYWRYRAGEQPGIIGDQTEPPKRRDIRDYKPEIVGGQVQYTDYIGKVAFVDRGRIINIYSWRNSDSVLAALQLSAQKWGSMQVTGNDEFKAMCVQLAAEHGFKITNPELQENIKIERLRIQQERKAAYNVVNMGNAEVNNDTNKEIPTSNGPEM